jgi:GDP-L-fucose synthase
VAGQDIVIQAAATTSGAGEIVSKPYIHVTDNAVMNSLLLRSAYEHNISHFVFFSCTIMYSSQPDPLKESDFDANAPMHDRYFGAGWTKVYCEKQCEFYAGLGRTKHTVLRHSNIYGPHDKFDLKRSHVFGATMTKILQAEGDKIVVWGTGEEERDLLYVDDLCDAVNASIERQEAAFGIYNIGAGHSVSIKHLVKTMLERAQVNLKIEHDLTKPTIPTKLCVDFAKAESELGWRPQTSLEDGIERTLAWYRKNL